MLNFLILFYTFILNANSQTVDVDIRIPSFCTTQNKLILNAQPAIQINCLGNQGVQIKSDTKSTLSFYSDCSEERKYIQLQPQFFSKSPIIYVCLHEDVSNFSYSISLY